MLLAYVPGTTNVELVKQALIQRDRVLQDVREHLCEAQNRMNFSL